MIFDELTFGPIAFVIAIIFMLLSMTGCGGMPEPEMEVGCLVFVQGVDFVTTATVSCSELPELEL